jgi:hypothetical protein
MENMIGRPSLSATSKQKPALAEIGVRETERNLNNKISRGGFTAAFLIQCLEATETHTLRLEDARLDHDRNRFRSRSYCHFVGHILKARKRSIKSTSRTHRPRGCSPRSLRPKACRGSLRKRRLPSRRATSSPNRATVLDRSKRYFCMLTLVQHSRGGDCCRECLVHLEGFGVWQRDYAKAATDLAKIAQSELTERPWMEATIEVVAPLTFDQNGAHNQIRYTVKNSGHSPATNIWRGSKLCAAGDGPTILGWENDLCTGVHSDIPPGSCGWFISFPN